MKIYIDNLILLNFLFDTLILLTVSIILKRNIKIKRIILGGFIASLSIFTLFINFNLISLNIVKLLLMIIIVIITFGFKNIKYTFDNIIYFFITNIIYGGFLYFLNIEFNYKNVGLAFYNKININYLFLIIISPIILYIYMKCLKKLKYEFSLLKNVDIYLKNGEIIKLKGYHDTGNKLIDPYKKRYVILTNNKKIEKYMNNYNKVLVPYDTIDSHGLISCLIPKRVYIEGIGSKNNVIIGFINKEFNLNTADCILNGGL